MKILFINSTYAERSTGKLVMSFLDYASTKGNEVAAIYNSGPKVNSINYIKIKNPVIQKVTIVLERLFGTYSFSPFATFRTLQFMKFYKPDIVYLGNLHGYYLNFETIYRFLNQNDIPTVQVMWDEFAMTGSCTFAFECEKFKGICKKCPRLRDYPFSLFDNSTRVQEIKHRAYKFNKVCYVSVPYTAKRAKESYLLKDKRVIELDEAVDQLNIFFPRDTDILRKNLGISSDKIIVLTVGIYPSERKGCKYFLELARKCEEYHKFVFIHVGFNGDTNECPSNYIPISYMADQQMLAQYYSLADIFVCTSLAETQPNTCLESLSCGTRICGFNISGIPTCAEQPFGRYVDVGDVNGLKMFLLGIRKKSDREIQDVVSYARKRFSSEKYDESLLKIGKNIVRNKEIDGNAD